MADRGAIDVPTPRTWNTRLTSAGKVATGDSSPPAGANPSGTLTNAVTKAAQARELAESIARDIRKLTGRKIRHLAVEVEGNRVRLAGTCSTFYAKQLAQHAALEGAGDRSI